MQRASQIIGQISAASKRSKTADRLLEPEPIACAAWARAVGKKIAQHTTAVKLVRGRLIVDVEDVTWQRNLFTLTLHIKSNLQKALGPGIVTELDFRVMPRRREPQRAVVSSPSSAFTTADESDAIEDPGMRRVYRAARQRELALKELA